MKFSYFYIYLILLSLSTSGFAYNQSNVADQDFIDNADQFSNENGVRIFSGDSDSVIQEAGDLESSFNGYIDPSQIPVSKKKSQIDNSKEVKSRDSDNIGFSFFHMANKSKKQGVLPKVNSKKVGFSFFKMAENSKKIPTNNKGLKY
jgi:hypothetical protein